MEELNTEALVNCFAKLFLSVENIYMGTPEVKVVKIKSIRENPVALRSVDRESEEYLGLRDSISRMGVLNPINVRRRSEEVEGVKVDYYELVDGLHRYTSAVEAGLDSIPVNILTLEDVEVLEAQLMTNIHRIETKPVEYTKQLQRIFNMNPTMTMTEMAARLAKSPSWLNQRLGLLKLSSEVQSLVDDGKITVANAVAMSKLPHEEQVNYVDNAITMTTDEFAPIVTSRAKELREAARAGRAAEPAKFEPVAHPRKLGELKEEYLKPSVGPELCRQAGAKTAEQGFALGVAFAISLDPVSVASQEAKENERRQKLEDAKKKRALERAQKKADEAADAAAKAAEAAGL
ncbi:MAG: ParB/RepB/Spo0J family partition protein [Clostridia bacterium]|jgi:ParB/RepB/Spo0J family partition protein